MFITEPPPHTLIFVMSLLIKVSYELTWIEDLVLKWQLFFIFKDQGEEKIKIKEVGMFFFFNVCHPFVH
jgi:hypothetical protein